MEIACLTKEVLNEQFGPLKKDKGKTTLSGNNNKNVINQPQVPQMNGQNNNNTSRGRKRIQYALFASVDMWVNDGETI